MEKYFFIDSKVTAKSDAKLDTKTLENLWQNFTANTSKVEIIKGEENTFIIGEPSKVELGEDKEYAFSVTEKGIYLVGKDKNSLLRGIFALLMKIERQDKTYIIKETCAESNYLLKNRMIHICVFPENDFYFIKKLIRFLAVCQYTHVVIEFWGTLKFDCLKELAWPNNAFTKEEAKELINECRKFGIEPIPMFNHLGHATASRECYGKHVVLDQNLSYDYLFTPDGWAWDITSDEVFDLLKKIRLELYELFGEGEYIHLGFDEAYYISANDHLRKQLPDFLGELTREAEKEGRRPMIWMDMLLERNTYKDCVGTGRPEETEALRSATAPSTVFVDWQYYSSEVPIPTLKALENCGRDVMGAPWFSEKVYKAHIDTLKQGDMFGIMMTTWHTIKDNMKCILDCSKKMGTDFHTWSRYSAPNIEAATLWRRIAFEGNEYSDAGFAKEQIEI